VNKLLAHEIEAGEATAVPTPQSTLGIEMSSFEYGVKGYVFDLIWCMLAPMAGLAYKSKPSISRYLDGLSHHSCISQSPLFSDKTSLCLWDCSGQERFRPFVQQVLDRATVAVLCYDHRSEAGLRELQFWRNELQRVNADAALIVAATRADLAGAANTATANEAKLSADDISKQVTEWRATHVVTSAATGLGLSQLLTAILEAGVKVTNADKDNDNL